MYFVNEYTPKGELPDDVELKKVAARAQASSLDPVAWGLAYPDFLRLLLPVNFRADRGLALEEAWMRKDEEGWGARAGLRRGLAEWRADAEAGLRPASIFNTTITDTGERLTLASCDLSAASARSALLRGPGGARPQGRKNFEDVFGEVGGGRYDLAVVTAARLSATFPYVSPAARADLGGAQAAQSHVVDGGYYDNYGVSSLVEWLDDELTKRREAAQGAGLGRAGGEAAAERVLIILVEGAPPDPNEHKSPRGWFYQAFAPLSTLLHVRDTGQRSHNTVELELLKEKWEMLGVAVTSVVFDFDGDNSPLSWHLTDEEKCRIESKWGDELKGKWAPVRDFLVGGGAVSLDAGAAYRADPPAGCPARP
jgi:hypothetical protein